MTDEEKRAYEAAQRKLTRALDRANARYERAEARAREIERKAMKALIDERASLRAQFRDEEAEIYERFHPAA